MQTKRILQVLRLLPLVSAAACMQVSSDDVEFRYDTDTDGCEDPPAPPEIDPDALYPSAPSAQKFMWPGGQTDLHTGSGAPWTGSIVLAMTEKALCFKASNGELKCAGSLYQQPLSSSFVGTGIFDPVQVRLDPASVSDPTDPNHGAGMCVLVDGTLRCKGSNTQGEYGVGNTAPVPTLTQWGALDNIVHFSGNQGGGTCAVTDTHKIYCAGPCVGDCQGAYYQATPTQKHEGADAFHLDYSSPGVLSTDTSTVWRDTIDGTGDCGVTVNGLTCTVFYEATHYGIPGQVVMGGLMDENNPCWLTTAGEVLCQDWTGCVTKHFTARPVLALAVDYESLCAVYNDGSLSCIGQNSYGRFGTGNQDPLVVETVVQPPESVYLGTGCDPGCAGTDVCESGVCVDGSFRRTHAGNPETGQNTPWSLDLRIDHSKFTPGSNDSYVYVVLQHHGSKVPKEQNSHAVQMDFTTFIDKFSPNSGCYGTLRVPLVDDMYDGEVWEGYIRTPCGSINACTGGLRSTIATVLFQGYNYGGSTPNGNQTPLDLHPCIPG